MNDKERERTLDMIENCAKHQGPGIGIEAERFIGEVRIYVQGEPDPWSDHERYVSPYFQEFTKGYVTRQSIIRLKSITPDFEHYI